MRLQLNMIVIYGIDMRLELYAILSFTCNQVSGNTHNYYFNS